MKTLIAFVAVVLIVHTGCAADADKKEEPAPAGPITVTIKSDKAKYMHGEPGVVYIMAPTGRMKATLVVKNVSDKAQTLEFRSGQKYDFIIRDAKGKELSRWSSDKAFMAVIQEEELGEGKEMKFQETLSLGGVGKPLPLGDYILEGVFTCHPLITTTMKFKIIPTPAK